MSLDTRAFFVVSSGRSGTAMLHKALSASDDVEMHHEYMVHIVQPLAIRRYMRLIDSAEAKRVIENTHAAAAHYSEKRHWGDSSNKLAWLIPELAELFPDARFVHLVRDGRKVASSYFHKLGDECYDDRSSKLLRAYAEDPSHVAAPPPEKKYWWPQPVAGMPFAEEFQHFDQFQRIAWHWCEINRVILQSLARLESRTWQTIRLEDLRRSPDALRALYDFLNLPYQDENFSMFAKPHNVNRPEDRLLDATQRMQFGIIAGAMMEQLGYAEHEEYVVNY
jgi:hypothetical protein